MSNGKYGSVPATGRPGTVRPYLGVIAAAVLLLAGGVGYRVVAAYVGAEMAHPIRLDPPLSSLPLVIGAWQGEEVPLREGVVRIAGNDDYVSRVYRHAETGETVSLYIGYTARPRTMLRHRPSVCYPSAGWTPLHAEEAALPVPLPSREGFGEGSVATSPRSSGPSVPRPLGPSAPVVSSPPPHVPTVLPVRIQSFLKPTVPEQRVVVLNYYVLNGRPTIDEHSFWGLTWRDPNRGRDATRYVAQIQVTAPAVLGSDAAQRVVERFAAEAASVVLPLLPEVSGPPGPAIGGAR